MKSIKTGSKNLARLLPKLTCQNPANLDFWNQTNHSIVINF